MNPPVIKTYCPNCGGEIEVTPKVKSVSPVRVPGPGNTRLRVTFKAEEIFHSVSDCERLKEGEIS